MAENETLDTNVSPRWQRVCRAFRDGEAEGQMEQRIRRNVDLYIRGSIKNIADKGVGMDELLQAATACPHELRELLRRCRQHDFARLIADNAEPGITRLELLQRTMNALGERVEDQIACKVVPCPSCPNFTDFYGRFDQIREGLRPDLERIANRLAENPEWKPRVPSRRKVAAPAATPLFDGPCADDVTAASADPATEETRALLAESLLNRRPEQ